MDPQSQAFTPYSSNNDTWRIQSEVGKIIQTQAEHAERLLRLERRQDEDARVKSVWGSGSPFPSVLSGTPQQAPLQQPADHFRNFDEDTSNLMSSLHLDAEEEPRRSMAATSRANSVRFDESANQNHFSHLPRPSFDYLSRNNSSIGGLSLGERSASGRASSAHSVRSAASGRASLNLDTTYLADGSRSSQEAPTLAPGLAFLGSVPAILRCWLTMQFKHDSLLYAAVCTGSHKSYLSLSLLKKLNIDDLITTDNDGNRVVRLPVFFAEAVPHPASSRSSSPAPQLPCITVTFQIADAPADVDSKCIKVVLGSDTLRLHNADVLFSTSSMTLFDDDGSKLSMPLVRPEDAAAFQSLRTIDASIGTIADKGYVSDEAAETSTEPVTSAAKYRAPVGLSMETASLSDVARPASRLSEETRPTSRGSATSRPSLSLLSRAESVDVESSAAAASARSTNGSPAVWSNWRKEQTPTSAHAPTTALTLDWAAASKNREVPYQRKDTGIKVLKPKSASRAVSTGAATIPVVAATSGSADFGRSSRFFDEGRRKSGPSLEAAVAEKKDSATANNDAPKTRTNPIGGGSAFSWLNSGTK